MKKYEFRREKMGSRRTRSRQRKYVQGLAVRTGNEMNPLSINNDNNEGKGKIEETRFSSNARPLQRNGF